MAVLHNNIFALVHPYLDVQPWIVILVENRVNTVPYLHAASTWRILLYRMQRSVMFVGKNEMTASPTYLIRSLCGCK